MYYNSNRDSFNSSCCSEDRMGVNNRAQCLQDVNPKLFKKLTFLRSERSDIRDMLPDAAPQSDSFAQ